MIVLILLRIVALHRRGSLPLRMRLRRGLLLLVILSILFQLHSLLLNIGLEYWRLGILLLKRLNRLAKLSKMRWRLLLLLLLL